MKLRDKNSMKKVLPILSLLVAFAGGLFPFVSHARGINQTLCVPPERDIWSCYTGKTIHSICVSSQLSLTGGYMQYRSGSASHIKFVYPRKSVAPKGYFTYSRTPHGAGLLFEDAGLSYTIAADVRSPSIVMIERGDKIVSRTLCKSESHSLMENGTQKIFLETGIDDWPNELDDGPQ